MLQDNDMKPGTLSIVATPIGHYKDITLRALDVLGEVDAVICEEARPGSTLLKKHDIQKTLILLNEHNEKEAVPQIIQRLLAGEHLALISDCGTPVFADPGRSLLQAAAECGIVARPVPGPSSLMAAISVCKFDLQRFIFGGFLPRERQERRKALSDLQTAGIPVILMDAPYRLQQMLEDTAFVFGQDHLAMLGCDLTLPGERVLQGSLRHLMSQTVGKKCEFVLILAGRSGMRGGDLRGSRSGKHRK
jgi:16S rRNA (cytidine1402-2'-O)-methyltransferase